MQIKCDICGRSFTRNWNLQRHLHDVHDINEKKNMVKINIHNRYSLPTNNEDNITFSNRVINMKDTYNYQNFFNDNIFWDDFPSYGYNNIQPHPYQPQYPPQYPPQFTSPNINSQSKSEKEEWNLNERLKMQEVLKILQNDLGKIDNPHKVAKSIQYLHYRCVTEKSIEPLRRFFVKLYKLPWSY